MLDTPTSWFQDFLLFETFLFWVIVLIGRINLSFRSYNYNIVNTWSILFWIQLGVSWISIVVQSSVLSIVVVWLWGFRFLILLPFIIRFWMSCSALSISKLRSLLSLLNLKLLGWRCSTLCFLSTESGLPVGPLGCIWDWGFTAKDNKGIYLVCATSCWAPDIMLNICCWFLAPLKLLFQSWNLSKGNQFASLCSFLMDSLRIIDLGGERELIIDSEQGGGLFLGSGDICGSFLIFDWSFVGLRTFVCFERFDIILAFTGQYIFLWSAHWVIFVHFLLETINSIWCYIPWGFSLMKGEAAVIDWLISASIWTTSINISLSIVN